MTENIAVQVGPDGSETAFNPTVLASYRRCQTLDLRYNDVDPLGHVTSISFLNCLETARVEFFADSGHPVDDPNVGWMLVKLDIDYLGQLHYPGSVTIGTRLLRVGRSSVTTIQGLFAGDRCCATLRSILVHVERGAERAAEIPADLRTALWQACGTTDNGGDAS